MYPKRIRYPKKSNGVKKAIREGHLEAPISPCPFKRGHMPWNKNKTGVYSQNSLEMMSQSALTPERVVIAIDNLPQSATGTRHPMFGRRHSEESKHKMGITNIGNKYNLGRKHTDETKRRLSIIAKGRHQNLEYTKEVMRSRRPTDIEQKVIDIIEKYELPYKYTGDGSFLIGRFNPDFVNINSEKIAIDIFGDYWHETSEVLERKIAFAEYGWTLLILWGHEVKELPAREIVIKIKEGRND